MTSLIRSTGVFSSQLNDYEHFTSALDPRAWRLQRYQEFSIDVCDLGALCGENFYLKSAES
jgi:hypothetical protein